MSGFIKVEGHTNLVRDTKSNAIINTSTSEYAVYMRRYKQREKQSDELRDTIKEINTLKQELFELKKMIKEGFSKK